MYNYKFFTNIIRQIPCEILYKTLNITKCLQALGQAVKPVVNARYEAYQMRVQGRNYNANVAEKKSTNHALESMLRPEVLNLAV